MSHLGPGTVPRMWRLSTRTSRCLFSPPRQPGLQAGKASGPVGAAGGRWLSVRSPPLLLPWCWGPQVGLPCRGPPQPWPDERQTWPRASLWLHLRGGKEATGRGALPLLPQTHVSAPGARTAPTPGPCTGTVCRVHSYDPDQQPAQRYQQAECSEAEPRPHARTPYAPKHGLPGTELSPEPVSQPRPRRDRHRGGGGEEAGSSAGPAHSTALERRLRRVGRTHVEGRYRGERKPHTCSTFSWKNRARVSERKTKHRPQTPSSEVSTGTANPKDREDVPRRPRAPGGE